MDEVYALDAVEVGAVGGGVHGEDELGVCVFDLLEG